MTFHLLLYHFFPSVLHHVVILIRVELWKLDEIVQLGLVIPDTDILIGDLWLPSN
jgi:hypothetical protein